MMRFAIQAAALALLAMPALAQTTPPAAPDTTTAPAAPAAPAPTTAPATAAPPAAEAPPTPVPAPKKVVGHRRSLAQRFAAANPTHDGHLTKDQATAAKWSYVTRHFAAMDVGSKGYVTIDEIRAYARAQRMAHPRTPATPPATAPAPAAPAPTNG